MRLDLGGIAKGYATDAAPKCLQKGWRCPGADRRRRRHDSRRCAAGRTGWKIASLASLDPDRRAGRFLRLSNCGVATSGDAHQYVEIDGVRIRTFSTPAPASASPSGRAPASSCPREIQADALTKAVVLGAEEGLRVSTKRRTPAHFGSGRRRGDKSQQIEAVRRAPSQGTNDAIVGVSPRLRRYAEGVNITAQGKPPCGATLGNGTNKIPEFFDPEGVAPRIYATHRNRRTSPRRDTTPSGSKPEVIGSATQGGAARRLTLGYAVQRLRRSKPPNRRESSRATLSNTIEDSRLRRMAAQASRNRLRREIRSCHQSPSPFDRLRKWWRRKSPRAAPWPARRSGPTGRRRAGPVDREGRRHDLRR